MKKLLFYVKEGINTITRLLHMALTCQLKYKNKKGFKIEKSGIEI